METLKDSLFSSVSKLIQKKHILNFESLRMKVQGRLLVKKIHYFSDLSHLFLSSTNNRLHIIYSALYNLKIIALKRASFMIKIKIKHQAQHFSDNIKMAAVTTVVNEEITSAQVFYP